MMKLKWFIVLTFFAALGTAIPTLAEKAKDRIVLFDASPNVPTFPTSINHSGEITGYYIDPSQVFHGFTRDKKGTITTFDAPGAGTHGTFPVSINGRGEIAGYYYGASVFVTHGFVRHSDGTFTSFDVGPNTQTFPVAINDRDEIAGYYNDAGFPHGFVRAADGTTATFAVLGPSTITFPTSINPRGEITGSYQGHGFLQSR